MNTHDIAPEDYINIEGSEGQSIFRRALIWCLDDQTQKKIERRNKEIIDRMRHLKDDRATVLVGALLVESSVDELLTAMIPGFKELVTSKEVTFSVKIELARALQVCPSRLFSAADTVRRIRNEFAHNLTIDSFEKLKELVKGKAGTGRALLQSARDHLSKFNPKFGNEKNDTKAFTNLVLLTTLALSAYSYHAVKFNEFVRTQEFFETLKNYCEKGKP